MTKLAVLIHGMWATPDVWRNWGAFLEVRGWQTTAPGLRHHEAAPLAPLLELPHQGHRVLGQPGWQRIAQDTVAWMDGKAA